VTREGGTTETVNPPIKSREADQGAIAGDAPIVYV